MVSVVEVLWKQAWEDIKAELDPLLRRANLQVDRTTWVSESEIQAFIKDTEDINWAYIDTRGSTRRKLTTFIKALHRSAVVVDVIAQSQPFQISLAWGAARFIILIAVASVETAEKLADILSDVLCHVRSWNIEAQVFASSPVIGDNLKELFGCVIVLLVKARIYVCSNKFKRMLKSAFSDQLADTIRSIEKYTTRLDHRIRAESLQSSALAHKKEETFRKATQKSRAASEKVILVWRASDTEIDAAFLDLASEKMQLYSSGIRNVITEDLELVLKWLRQGVCAVDEIPSPEPGTCEWLYEFEEWKTWNSSTTPTPALLITGLPGSGKSVLTNSYAQRETRIGAQYVMYFSFGATSTPVMKDAAGFAVFALYTALQEASVTDGDSFRGILHEFTILMNTWKDVRQSPVSKLLKVLAITFGLMPKLMLIVDALDECSADHVSLLHFFITLSAQSQVRVVISARDHLLTQAESKTFFHLSINLECTQTDIACFVSKEIRRTPPLQKLKDEIRKAVLQHCKGIFLQATLMLNALKECKTTGAQKQTMADFKDSLSESYEQLVRERSMTFSAEEIAVQNQIFLTVVAAKKLLTAEEVYHILLMQPETGLVDEDARHMAPAEEIIRLCQPLLKIGHHDTVQIVHATAREYLVKRVSQAKSDLYLARKTLGQLTQSYYRQWKTPAALLRRHVLSDTTYNKGDEESYSDNIFYNYSVEHFQDHVTVLNDPPKDVVDKLARFLQGTEFVTWSEVLFDLKLRAGLGPQVLVYQKLLTWITYLPPATQIKIPIKDFFEVPHRHLADILEEKSQDRILQYLPFVRLGDYYNVAGQSTDDFQKAYDFKKEVVGGITSLLGARNPVTLRFRVSMLREYFWQKRFDEANHELREVIEIQRDIFDHDTLDKYLTLELLAGSLYCMTKFDESLPIYDEIDDGLRKLLGTSHPQYFMSEFFHGQALEQCEPLEKAATLYQDVLDRWVVVVGPLNPLGLMVEVALGSVQRKQGQYKLAEVNLLEGYAGRKQLFSIDNNVCLDSAVQLALLYRDIGKLARAIELLDSVSDSRVYQEDFERACQTQHLRALVKLDAGDYEAAKPLLTALLENVNDDRNRNNRELLWVRCTLADAERQRGDDENALRIFEKLVEPVGTTVTSAHGALGDAVYIETNEELRVAEKAVRLVREGKQTEARHLLEKKALQWVREKDFWILGEGGPLPDTSRIRPVNLDTPILVEDAA